MTALRACIHEAGENKACSQTPGDEETRVAFCRCRDVAKELLDTAVLDAVRNIGDGHRQIFRIVGQTGHVLLAQGIGG